MSENEMTKSLIDSEKSNPDKNKIHILIVDDDTFIHELIPSYLNSPNLVFHHSYSGHEDFKILNRYGIEVIFTDLVLPKTDGIALTRSIKSNLKFSTIYIVGMTGYPGSREEEKCLSNGMNGFIRKPFDHEVLSKVFQSFLDYKASLDNAMKE